MTGVVDKIERHGCARYSVVLRVLDLRLNLLSYGVNNWSHPSEEGVRCGRSVQRSEVVPRKVRPFVLRDEGVFLIAIQQAY